MAPPKDTNSFEDIMGRLRNDFATPGELILPNSLGPISVDHLTNFKGWTYDLMQFGLPGNEIPLVRGAAPTILAQFTDEKGWLQNMSFGFRSPFAEMTFTADNHIATSMPFGLNIVNQTVPNGVSVYCPLYNPATPFGPLYGISWNPNYPWPYERRVMVSVRLPSTAPIQQTTMAFAGITRIKITDYRIFLRSIKKFNLEQMSGVKIDRFP